MEAEYRPERRAKVEANVGPVSGGWHWWVRILDEAPQSGVRATAEDAARAASEASGWIVSPDLTVDWVRAAGGGWLWEGPLPGDE
jgi:hypothetical protein